MWSSGLLTAHEPTPGCAFPAGGRVVRSVRPVRPSRAFTVVELMVVIGIIALILALGVPAFNAMTTQQRLSKTRTLLDGALTRTHVICLSDRNLAAVRIFPANWHLSRDQALAGSQTGRQMLATYVYRSTYAADPGQPDSVHFHERFERLEDGPTRLLPPDTWVAPGEALDTRTRVPDLGRDIGDLVLDGTIGRFELDADSRTNRGEGLLDADDFLIVFDPGTGVRPSFNRQPWPLRAYVPEAGDLGPGADDVAGQEAAGDYWTGAAYNIPFQRFSFTGVVIYQRDPFLALGVDADPDQRRDVLHRFGSMYYVDRTGGSLVAGAGEAREE